MKKPITLLVLILLAVTIGCGGKDASNEDFITVDVTAKYPKKELILQDFLDVEYIPLETTDEFLTSANIRAIGKDIMLFTNLRWGDEIFIFDRNGKGLRKFNRSGQGPEEYTFILRIVLDEDNDEIFVSDQFLAKVFVYDLFGNFKRSFKQKESFFYDLMGNFDEAHLICHVDHLEYRKMGVKGNYFLLVSKQDGSSSEIEIPYGEKKSTMLLGTGANGRTTDRYFYNREQIPNRDSWILTEPSADTIYSYSADHIIKPYIVRTPSVQSMNNPEVFLFPGVQTDRYCFMQIVKKEYDFVADIGFPRTDIVYDKQENNIFECTVYNGDFIDKKPISLIWELPMFIYGENEIAYIKRLEAFDLVDAYEKGQLKGKLKEIAATLNEESNPVIMLAKHKKY